MSAIQTWFERNLTVSTVIQLVALLLTGSALYFGLDKQIALLELRLMSVETTIEKLETKVDSRLYSGSIWRDIYPGGKPAPADALDEGGG